MMLNVQCRVLEYRCWWPRCWPAWFCVGCSLCITRCSRAMRWFMAISRQYARASCLRTDRGCGSSNADPAARIPGVARDLLSDHGRHALHARCCGAGVVDLCTCVLIAIPASLFGGRRVGLASLWLAALCPFTANYAAVALAETLSPLVALAFFALERWTGSGGRGGRLGVVPAGWCRAVVRGAPAAGTGSAGGGGRPGDALGGLAARASKLSLAPCAVQLWRR